MDTPALLVNGQAVSLFELRNAMREYAEQMLDRPLEELSSEEQQDVFETSVERLVVWELIYQRSLADGEGIDDAEVEAELDDIAAQFEDRAAMEAALVGEGADLEILTRSVRRELLVSRIIDDRFDAVPEPGEDDLEAVYAEFLSEVEGEPPAREEIEPLLRDLHRQKVGNAAIQEWIETLRGGAEVSLNVEP